MKKKGQLGNLQTVIVSVLILGILLAAGFLLLEEVRENERFFEAASVTNETGGYINSTGYTLGGASDAGARNFVITQAVNKTNSTGYPGAYIIGSGNWTISDDGVVTNKTASLWQVVNFTYTYERGTEGYKGMASTITATMTVPNLLGLLLLIVIVGVVLAIILRIIPVGEGVGA